MVEGIIQALSGLAPQWRVFWLSMLPVTELRGSIPLGVLWDMEPWSACAWAMAGNFVPIIPLLLLLGWLLKLLGRVSFLAGPLQRLDEHNRRKSQQVRRYGMTGLMLLVAIPLPGTGVWTGCMVATLLALPLGRSLLAITAGELIAGVLVTLAVSGAVVMAEWRYGWWLLGGAVIAAALIFFFNKRRKK